jgi:hypothetical protein
MSNAQSADDRMESLDRRAKVARSRLMRTLDALDTRRHQVVEIGETAKKLAMPAALTVIGAAALLGIGVFAFSLGFRSRHRRSLGYRMTKSVAKVIRDLEIIPQPSFGRRALERTALALISVATAEVARRVMKNGVDGRLLDGRFAVGKALDQHHEQIAVRALTSSASVATT